MSMTRRDYVDLADAFRREVTEINEMTSLTDDEREACIETVKSLADKVARIITNRNPGFDTDRFMNDCGLKG